MQSVDEFTPSTTEPVFGSGLVSSTKNQLSTNNDITDSEKVAPSSETVVNGQNDKVTSNENMTNGTSEAPHEKTGASDSSVVHLNGENEKPVVEPIKEVQSAEKATSASESTVTEQPSQVPSIEPKVSAPVDTVKEDSSSVTTTTVTEPTPTTTTAAAVAEVDDNVVPEAPVATDSVTAETKSKSPRGRAKAPPAAVAPTRQSARGRKAASSSSNVEETPTADETGATTTTAVAAEAVATNQNVPSKRQAAVTVKDITTGISQISSTSGSTNVDEGNDQDMIATHAGEDVDMAVGTTEKASSSPAKKRGASTSGAGAAKKARGKNSITSVDDVDSGAGTSESEVIQSPPKKARTSAIKKTPEPPSEEYARKLRPRK